MAEPGIRPLDNPRQELFAVRYASGLTAQRAYQLAWSPTTPTPSRPPLQNRMATRSCAPGVADRVRFLRRAALAEYDDDADISRSVILDLMGEVTDALMGAAEAVDKAGASPREAQAIRKMITVHAGRVQRLMPQRAFRHDVTPDLDLSGPLVRLGRCACPHP